MYLLALLKILVATDGMLPQHTEDETVNAEILKLLYSQTHPTVVSDLYTTLELVMCQYDYL